MEFLNKIIVGDVLDKLKDIPDGSIRCCITSPPYYGLRDYGTGIWTGGDENCKHLHWKNDVKYAGEKQKTNNGGMPRTAGQMCKKCGAIRIDKQIGLETTPEKYIEKMVTVFREVRRILSDDGTLWLNIGDTYYGSGGATGQSPQATNMGKPRIDREYAAEAISTKGKHLFLKPKDLIGIPWMLAFALRADGWYLRSEIIWAKAISGEFNKGTCMPESVQDRPTKSHEQIFLLSKSEKYFYDHEAIKEDSIYADSGIESRDKGYYNGKTNNVPRLQGREAFKAITGKRNKRSVWHYGPAMFSEAHFATFPPALIVDMIKASTSEKGQCSCCGKPYNRVTEDQNKVEHTGKTETQYDDKSTAGRLALMRQKAREYGNEYQNAKITVGWAPTCDCQGEPIPDTVIDPFMGAGTTALVARKLYRNFVGTELNPDYVKIAVKRLRSELGMFSPSNVKA